MRKYLFCLLFLLISSPASGLEIAGVKVPETLDGGLQLNGAGIRSKLFFKIYIGELYLAQPSRDAAEILNSPGPKRMIMHFLYDKVEKEKLVEGWNEGFSANLSSAELQELSSKIEQFNALFVDVHAGEQIILDYTPVKGTAVSIAGERKGVIEGQAFSRALLSIWLGDKPVTKDLRDALLGKN